MVNKTYKRILERAKKRSTYRYENVFVVMSNFDVHNQGYIRNYELRQLHISCNFPHKNVCLRLSGSHQE